MQRWPSDFEKPDEVHTLFHNEIPQKMWPVPAGDLFTVGSSTAEKLEKSRIRNLDKAYDAINSKFGASTIMRGSSLQSKLDVGKKYRAQMEQKKESK